MIGTIKLNYLYSLLNKIVIIATSLITIPYLSRVLGPEKIGIKSYTMSLSYLFIILATFGIFTLAQREIARSRDSIAEYSKVFWNIFLSSSIIIFIFLCVWAIFVANTDKYQLYYLILSLSIFASFFDITWFYIGFEYFGKILVRNAIIKLGSLILIFSLIKSEQDIFLYILIACMTELCGNLSLWIGFKKNSKILSYTHSNYKPYYIKESLKYYIPSASLFIFIVIDKIMIGLLTENEFFNGIFEQSSTIILIILSIINSLNSIMSPRQSYLFKIGNIEEVHKKIKKSFDFILLIVYPSIIGLVIISNDIVTIFLGKHFNMASKIISLMSPLLLLMSISNIICLQYITPSGKLYLTNRIVLAGICCNIIGNLILIPNYGIEGAVISSIISESLILLLYIKFSNKIIDLGFIVKRSYKRLISCIAMALMILFIKMLYDNSYFIGLYVIIGAITYFLVILLIKDELAREIVYICSNSIKKLFKKAKSVL